MINLAGVKNCDETIITELKIAGIPVVYTEPDSVHREVPYTRMGKIGEFTFERAWYYWVVSGSVPIDVARVLYDNEIGRKDVRVNGHCGCPSPDEQAHWFLEEKKVLPEKEEEQFKSFIEKGILKSDAMEPYIFNDDPASIGAKAFITSYHIDSQLGLNLFVETLRKYHIIPDVTKPMQVIVQEWLESEAGWGQRPDGISIHTSMEEHTVFCKKYWDAQHKASPTTPNEYERESGDPWIGIIEDAEIINLLVDKKSLRLYRHTDEYKRLVSQGIKKVEIYRG